MVFIFIIKKKSLKKKKKSARLASVLVYKYHIMAK